MVRSSSICHDLLHCHVQSCVVFFLLHMLPCAVFFPPQTHTFPHHFLLFFFPPSAQLTLHILHSSLSTFCTAHSPHSAQLFCCTPHACCFSSFQPFSVKMAITSSRKMILTIREMLQKIDIRSFPSI